MPARILPLFVFSVTMASRFLHAEPPAPTARDLSWEQKSETGVVQGVIERVEYGGPSLVISTSGGLFSLRARGADLAPFAPGQIVTVAYAVYDDVPWLVVEEPKTPAKFLPAGRLGNAIGAVERIDRGSGRIVVTGPDPATPAVTGVAHPSDLDGVVPGQMISVDYVYLGEGLPTVLQIAPVEPSGQRLRAPATRTSLGSAASPP